MEDKIKILYTEIFKDCNTMEELEDKLNYTEEVIQQIWHDRATAILAQ